MSDKRRKMQKSYTLKDVQRINSTAIRELQRIILDTTTTQEQRIRAINALGIITSTYTKLVDAVDFEIRLTKLESNEKNIY